MQSEALTVSILVLLIAITEACGQIALKKCRIENKMEFFGLAIFCYIIVCLLLYKTYAYKEMGMVNVIWSGMSVLVIVTTSVILFNENLNYWDFLGIALIMLGMFFAFVKGH